jgi:hypothetical protein
VIAELPFAEFVASAEEAFARDRGDEALVGTGYLDLLRHSLDDPVMRSAVYATFLGQGRRLGCSSALFRLMARPYLAAMGRPVDDVAMALPLQVRETRALVAVPASCTLDLLLDIEDAGVHLVNAAAVTFAARPTFDRDLVAVGEIDLSRARAVLGPAEAARARGVAMSTGSLAAAFEMLGASESLLAIGVEHARGREQFGQPISSFQAVRHLLAWASVDVQAADKLCIAALRCGSQDGALLCQVTRAVAGRNGRRVSDRVAQVLGGMGFTWEHPFHRFHRRILVLDSLLGGSDRVMARLGRMACGQGDPASVLPLEGQVTRMVETA